MWDIRYKVLWIGKIAKHKGIGETKVLEGKKKAKVLWIYWLLSTIWSIGGTSLGQPPIGFLAFPRDLLVGPSEVLTIHVSPQFVE